MKVFLDTNILKFAFVERTEARAKKAKVNWGGIEHEVEYIERFRVNAIDKLQKNQVQQKDAITLPMLAYYGIEGGLDFYISQGVKLELMGLPNFLWKEGGFFGAQIGDCASPKDLPIRVIAGGVQSWDEHSIRFFGSIKNKRFVELTKITGAYQGEDRDLNLNQANDAFHIWCAEEEACDVFLTMDYKLKRVVQNSKRKPKIEVITPTDLLFRILKTKGVLRGLIFVIRAAFFAKQKVSFSESRLKF